MSVLSEEYEKIDEKSRQTVQPGKFVQFAYKVYDASNGELLFEAPLSQPDVMVFGASREIIPGLASTMEGLGEGDRFEVELPPAAAFGDYNPEDVLELDREIFMRGDKMAEEIKVGAMVPMMTAEGYRVMGKVLEIGDKVKMDFNHPFAGKTVRYQGQIVEVREATEEEIHPTSGCGGCCGGGCGDSDGDGCGGGCDSKGGCCGGC